jgi:hypothetical protein
LDKNIAEINKKRSILEKGKRKNMVKALRSKIGKISKGELTTA